MVTAVLGGEPPKDHFKEFIVKLDVVFAFTRLVLWDCFSELWTSLSYINHTTNNTNNNNNNDDDNNNNNNNDNNNNNNNNDDDNNNNNNDNNDDDNNNNYYLPSRASIVKTYLSWDSRFNMAAVSTRPLLLFMVKFPFSSPWIMKNVILPKAPLSLSTAETLRWVKKKNK